MSSILPCSDARASMISLAASRSLLSVGSFRCGQLELFPGLPVMVAPLKGTSMIACPSLKSFTHPTFGQTFGSLATTEQNFV